MQDETNETILYKKKKKALRISVTMRIKFNLISSFNLIMEITLEIVNSTNDDMQEKIYIQCVYQRKHPPLNWGLV